MKYYAVKSGRKIGIFNSWEECQKQVSGYNNAIFKSFKSLEEAKKYLNGSIEQKMISENSDRNKSLAVAYVDGSYDNNAKVYGYGSIIFINEEKEIISGYGDDTELIELRNVAGEISAAIKTMEFCLEHKIKNLDIYYDYVGIENWFTGEWKANTFFTKEYVKFADKIKKNLNVKFIKIKAHSGDRYNEEVDNIAKNAIKEYIEKLNENTYYYNKINIDKLKESKVKSGKIEPVFNFVLDGQVLNNTSNIMNSFKKMWKADNRKLVDIIDMKVEINLSTNSIKFYVYLKDAKVVKIMRIEGE